MKTPKLKNKTKDLNVEVSISLEVSVNWYGQAYEGHKGTDMNGAKIGVCESFYRAE